ncbi:BTAD domain-containing putative transcriptional regulator [Streptosporangium sp. NPDC051022]|uniref:AfsR/SARP family transcriptional regulator n=1 Tax=Streptosporangium sp. NPDC051022 TaxID=3155752 RepID=UPI0034176FF3
MHFAILGQAQVTLPDGEVVRISRTKRRVLTALLLAGQHGLTTEVLVKAIWDDALPHARMGSLKSCIAQLRRLLPGCIPAGASSVYRIVLNKDDTFDVDQFRRLVTKGDGLVGRGDLSAGAAALQEALALWGELPLADLPEDVLSAVRETLLFERKTAVVELVKARLQLGQQREILADLRRESADDPLDEELHALLIRALYRSERRSDALRHYDDAVRVISEVTGRGPGAALRQAHAEATGDGNPSTATSAVALLSPAQLPLDVADFSGRTAEVAQLIEWLTPRPGATAVPVVGISGLGGVGKSVLATHAAHLLRPMYPDGQLFVDLAAMSQKRPIAEVLAELLMSLGVPTHDLPASVAGRAALLRSALAGRRILIMIDDAAGLAHAQPFLPGTAGCGALITSRSVLTGPGIRNLRLQPLGEVEALRLLEEIVGPDRTGREAEATRQVLAVCAGLPLAVRIVGSRLSTQPHWPIRLLADRVKDQLVELADGGLAVAASIAESYDALGADARHAFRVLSLAGAGDWPMWLAEMLLGKENGEAALSMLTMHSLLTPAGIDAMGHPRHRMHDLVRAFAAERLAENSAERDVALERLMCGWAELVALAEQTATGQEPFYPPPLALGMERYMPAAARDLITKDADSWFGAEATTIIGVVRQACDAGWHRLAHGIAARLSAYLFRRGLWRESQAMWRTVMHAAVAGGDAWLAEEARHHVASLILEEPGGPSRARPMLDLCAMSFEAIGHYQGLARALALRATCDYMVMRDGGVPPAGDAVADALRGLELARQTRNRYAEVACLRALGLLFRVHGEYDRAIDFARQAVELGGRITAERGEQTYQIWAAVAYAAVLLKAGHYEQALAVAEQARLSVGGVGTPSAEAEVVVQIAGALVGLGRLEEATGLYEEAAGLFAATGDPRQGRVVAKRAASLGG